MNLKVVTLLLLSVGVLFLQIGPVENIGRLKIAVYYECLCDDSVDFFVSQLYPAWKSMRPYIAVKLVPYGKATHRMRNGEWIFNCQHGEDECYGNKVHGCVLKLRTLSDEEKFKLIYCLIKKTHPVLPSSLYSCAAIAKVDYRPIEKCANSPLGDDILASYGDQTHALKPKITFVPTIIFNEVFNERYQDIALEDLKYMICKLAPIKPPQCK